MGVLLVGVGGGSSLMVFSSGCVGALMGVRGEDSVMLGMESLSDSKAASLLLFVPCSVWKEKPFL